jgi:O-antigen ligase
MKKDMAWHLIFAGCAALGAAVVTIAFPQKILPFILILEVLAIFTFLIFVHPAWLMIFIGLFASVVCMLRDVESLNVMGTTVSISGLGWGFVGGISLVLLGLHVSKVRIPKILLPLLLFVGWTITRWAFASFQGMGLKDILFYGLPPLIGIFVFFVLSNYGGDTVRKTENLMLATGLIPAFLYLVLIPLGLTTLTNEGPVGIIESRGIALFLLIILVLAFSRWIYGESRFERRTGAMIALVSLGTIIFTLSRMASVAAVLLVGLAVLRPFRFRIWFFGILALGSVAALVVLTVPAVREMFFFNQSSTNLLTILLSLKTSGRDVFWPATFQHAMANPFIGWGPGSARLLVAKVIQKATVNEYYPHNEYLQIFHDLGAIGLVLFLLGYIPLVVHFWKRWKLNHAGKRRGLAGANMAAFLSLFAVLVTSITANTLHYAFVTVPAFILIAFAYFRNQKAGESDE